MAPTFYHYLPVSMEGHRMGVGHQDSRQVGLIKVLLVLLLVLLMAVVVESVFLGIFITKAHSKGCQDGLWAEMECQNTTGHLRGQLTQVQESLKESEAQAKKAEVQATTCNSTVVHLLATLEERKAQDQKRQEQEQRLQEKIRDLTQQLQDARAEVERLRTQSSATDSSVPYSTASSAVTSVVLKPEALLLPFLAALWL